MIGLDEATWKDGEQAQLFEWWPRCDDHHTLILYHGLKTVRTSIRLDKEDIDFLKYIGVFEGIRCCIKLCRLHSILPINRMRTELM